VSPGSAAGDRAGLIYASVASHEYVSLACNDAETARRRRSARFSPFRDKRLTSIVGKFLPRLERSVFFAALCSRAARTAVINVSELWLTAIADVPIIYLFTQIA